MWLALWILCGICAVAISRARGRDTVGWGIVGFLLGPIGVALAYMMPIDHAAEELDRLAGGTAVRCPSCAELIRPEAMRCRFCGVEVEPRRERPRARKFNLD